MDWKQVSDNWLSFFDAIATRWPNVEESELVTLEGDRQRFERYLAGAHDLTLAEAREEVDVWLMGAMPADVTMAPERDNTNISSSASHIPPGEDVYAEDGDFGDDRVKESPLGRSGS